MKRILIFFAFVLNLLPMITGYNEGTIKAQTLDNEYGYECEEENGFTYISPIPCEAVEICRTQCLLCGDFMNCEDEWKHNCYTPDESEGKETLVLSFYQTQDADNAMLAVDFGKPVRIDKIKYMPRNDDNFITKGHQYALCYYGENGEVVHRIQTAENETLHFNDLPNNALFILHDQTNGKEERPFTINNGNIL